ncbi:hypothetical protein GCM10010174_06860 [Kutzneria viridogrisea]
MGSADGQDHDALGRQIPATPYGESLDGDLVAHPLDKHNDTGAFRPSRRHSRRLGRRRWPGHVTGEEILAAVRPHCSTVNHDRWQALLGFAGGSTAVCPAHRKKAESGTS